MDATHLVNEACNMFIGFAEALRSGAAPEDLALQSEANAQALQRAMDFIASGETPSSGPGTAVR